MAVREARLKADELEAEAAAREGRQPEVLPPISPHDLRRTYITMMHREGVDRLVLRSLVGHTHDAMTDHYVKLGDQDRRGALQVIEGGLKKERAG
jgi:integrase